MSSGLESFSPGEHKSKGKEIAQSSTTASVAPSTSDIFRHQAFRTAGSSHIDKCAMQPLTCNPSDLFLHQPSGSAFTSFVARSAMVALPSQASNHSLPRASGTARTSYVDECAIEPLPSIQLHPDIYERLAAERRSFPGNNEVSKTEGSPSAQTPPVRIKEESPLSDRNDSEQQGQSQADEKAEEKMEEEEAEAGSADVEDRHRHTWLISGDRIAVTISNCVIFSGYPDPSSNKLFNVVFRPKYFEYDTHHLRNRAAGWVDGLTAKRGKFWPDESVCLTPEDDTWGHLKLTAPPRLLQILKEEEQRRITTTEDGHRHGRFIPLHGYWNAANSIINRGREYVSAARNVRNESYNPELTFVWQFDPNYDWDARVTGMEVQRLALQANQILQGGQASRQN